MRKKDVYESDYLENTEIFADLVNGALYHGKQIVKPEELTEQDGELRSISERDIRKTIRDKVKLWNGTVFAIFAVENQTEVDYHMVLRAMLAESMAYDKQWKKRKAKYEKERPDRLKNAEATSTETDKYRLTDAEFLSGMKKGDKYIPVITIVVYYGKDKPWNGARTLYELLDVKENEEVILPFVSNYKLNIFDYHEHEDFGQFHSELQSVFEFLRYSADKKALAKKLEEHKENYEKLSSQAKILLAELTNIKEIPDVSKNAFEKGDFDMCKEIQTFGFPYTYKLLSYPNLFYQTPKLWEYKPLKGLHFLYHFIPQKSTKEPSGFFHFGGTFASFSHSNVANAFRSSSVVTSR